MGSKTFLLLGFSLAIALLISSEVSARDLAETEKSNVAATIDGHGGGGGGGCRHGWCGQHCCNHAGEAAEAEVANTQAATSEENSLAYQGGGGGGYHGGGGGGGGGGYQGGGGGGYHGGCRHGWCGRHCCNYAGEAVGTEENSVADTESKYQGGGGRNQGGGWNQGGGYPGGGGGWNQGGGGWNRGGGGYHGGGCRHGWCGRHCCYAGQAADAETQN